MNRLLSTALAAIVLLVLSTAACEPAADAETSTDQPAAMQVADAGISDSDFVVYKSPTCGCCTGWVEHLREAGHEVETVDVADPAQLQGMKRGGGVPADLGSCHTAVVEGYTIEGHVPAESIERLLRERPDIKGLAVPGMPIGSPGMEGPNPQRYEVIAFTEDGERSVYDVIDPAQPSSDTR